MKNFVVLSYGRRNEYQRAVFAVLSFWAWYGGDKAEVQTIIYTDNPDYFRPYLAGLPVQYELLTPGRLTHMRGAAQYLHRVKAVILEHVFAVFPAHDVLYADTDTFFTTDPAGLLARLAPGTSFMHQPEYRLQDAVRVFAAFGQQQYPERFLELLESAVFEVAGQPARFYSRQVAWNSGVLALSHQQASLPPDIRQVMDTFFEHTAWFVSEQLAFSLVLQHQTQLLSARPVVCHYWGRRQKRLMDEQLSILLRENFTQSLLAERLQCVQHLTLQWQRQVEVDRLREGSLYAFANRQPRAGIKYALKSLFKAPFSRYFVRRLLAMGRRTFYKTA
ncbi:hypothetical protein HNQ93_001627 [Hymenobacter luteus]|uniref:Nucleotide-diphospho-sugar transferase domain-containing protein n=2 Tax=Hymenobacter TaxID=89966 RepID=A0A7W9SZS9_9BACT|nr:MULTISPECIES: hypothetical protein [Hymenobacter]MBB4601012.1 hypothetical protein [Hymenobacter latericoloratus]MBB6058781.1 hypothetical protein [Hymenobacter luteus]